MAFATHFAAETEALEMMVEDNPTHILHANGAKSPYSDAITNLDKARRTTFPNRNETTDAFMATNQGEIGNTFIPLLHNSVCVADASVFQLDKAFSRSQVLRLFYRVVSFDNIGFLGGGCYSSLGSLGDCGSHSSESLIEFPSYISLSSPRISLNPWEIDAKKTHEERPYLESRKPPGQNARLIYQ
jgi:hypothetical protein